MKDNKEYRVSFFQKGGAWNETVLREIVRQREDDKNDKIELHLNLSWHKDYYFPLDDDHRQALLDFMDECVCTTVTVGGLWDNESGVKEILTKASKTWKHLVFSEHYCGDHNFQLILDLIVANGGIQKLTFDGTGNDDKYAWALFKNSKTIGNGDENSEIAFHHLDFSSEILDTRFARIIQNFSGFKKLNFENFYDRRYPCTFRTLGQVVSSPNCELSKLHVSGRCMIPFFKSVTSNNSLTELAIDCNDNKQLTIWGENLSKFHHLKTLRIEINLKLSSLDFLRPLADNSLELNQSLETLELDFWDPDENRHILWEDFEDFVEDWIPRNHEALLLLLAQRNPYLSSFGSQIWLSTPVKYALQVNAHRKFSRRASEIPLSIWPLVLAEFKDRKSHDELFSSICFMCIRDFLSPMLCPNPHDA